MAQLVKLHNYISRYERNIYHYPGQFIRLKKEKWKKANREWDHSVELPEAAVEELQTGWKKLWKRKSKETEEIDEFQKNNLPVILTDQEKKQKFLDSIFPFQLKWASSTISQMSFLDRDFKYDPTLKYFLQRFPDTYLLFYQPVFTLKNITMETDILLVGPYGIDIIKIVESNPGNRYTAIDDRTWFIESNGNKKNILSPLLSLNRTERVVKGILNLYNNDFPIRKIVLSRKNNISSFHTSFNTHLISSQAHESWLEKKREDAHLLKHHQLQVCELLLSHCDSVAFHRPEWDSGEESSDDDFPLNP